MAITGQGAIIIAITATIAELISTIGLSDDELAISRRMTCGERAVDFAYAKDLLKEAFPLKTPPGLSYVRPNRANRLELGQPSVADRWSLIANAEFGEADSVPTDTRPSLRNKLPRAVGGSVLP